jgi:DNA-binding transcriptional MerR regulator
MVHPGQVSDPELLLPGEFGSATRLSPKALRHYAEVGLLVPAHVDPVTGYRRYHRDQIGEGRLIARLRALDLPLARIATLLPLSPQARRVELRGWLAAQEDQLRHARELVDAFDGGDLPTGTPAVRARPERKLLCREQRVHIAELKEFEAESLDRIRARLRACGVDDDGPMLVYFHGMVTRDSDGPAEVAVAFAGAVEPVDDLRVRLQPAGDDVWLPVPKDDATFPAILRYFDAIEDWINEHGPRRGGYRYDGPPVEVWPGAGGAAVDVMYPVSREATRE